MLFNVFAVYKFKVILWFEMMTTIKDKIIEKSNIHHETMAQISFRKANAFLNLAACNKVKKKKGKLEQFISSLHISSLQLSGTLCHQRV